MKLPKVLQDLLAAQNSFNDVSYAQCFSETATVYDEGKTNGRNEIELWIKDANERYQARMMPVDYIDGETETLLKAQVSGDFPGSPILMTYHLKIDGDLIQSLKVTG